MTSDKRLATIIEKKVEVYPVKVNRERRITIPIPLAKKYNIEPGQYLILLDDGDKLRIVLIDEYLAGLEKK